MPGLVALSAFIFVTEHCTAAIHCPDNVDDIQAVKKSSTDQSNSSGQLLLSADK